VAGHTNTSAASPGGRLFRRQGAEISANAGATSYEAVARLHSDVETRIVSARGEKGTSINVVPVDNWDWTDWSQLADRVRSVLREDDWARSRNRKVASTGNFESPRALSFAFID